MSQRIFVPFTSSLSSENLKPLPKGVAFGWPWISGKKVLLPIGLSRIDYEARRLYVDGLSCGQVNNLPE